MPKPVLGISIRKFKVGVEAVFRVYGENLDNTAVPLTVAIKSSNFDWNPASYTPLNSDRKKHYVVVKSIPSPKALMPVADTDDDVTITLTFDPGSPDQDIAEEDYDTTYEP